MINSNSLQDEENSFHMREKIMREITTIEMMGTINRIDSHRFSIIIRIHIITIITEIPIHRGMMIIMIIITIRGTRIRDMKTIIIMMKMIIVIIIDLIILRTQSVKDLAPREKVSLMLYHRMFHRKGSAHQSKID